ncbi:MAG: hypothetical protein J5809_01705 [Selenomonadaceae bacterium]|nr:hypothetical protein [Selenomonadaceae bacterium]
MQTNGTLIDDAWIEFFRANDIGVGISLDGYPELHDKNRRTKNGEPTAEKILASLEKMRARQEFLKAHSCKDCADWELCHGGGAFEAVNAFGTLDAKHIVFESAPAVPERGAGLRRISGNISAGGVLSTT